MEIKVLRSKAYLRAGKFWIPFNWTLVVISGRFTWLTRDICRFGWTNASYVYGLSLLSLHAKRALGVQAPYELYAKALAEIRD